MDAKKPLSKVPSIPVVTHIIKTFIKRPLPWVLLLSLSTFTSCFDLLEEIDLNGDGSGTLTLTLNLSKSRTKIASLMLLDSVNGHKVPSEKDIQDALDEAVSFLKKEPGISSVTKKADHKNYIFSISCQFKNVDNLNGALKRLSLEQKTMPLEISYDYDRPQQRFTKSHHYDPEAKTQYDRLQEGDRKIFTEASYIAITRFQGEVAETSHLNAKISGSRKAVMLKVPALDLINGKINLTNTVKLKN